MKTCIRFLRQKQARLDPGETARLNDQLNRVKRELADRSANLGRSVGESADLNRKLAEVQSNALNLRARLSLIGTETSEDTEQALALSGQANDLKQAIEEKDKQIAESRELLDRDRDIRNLIGASNLYRAEIDDVGQSRDTQKLFGRMFYTKEHRMLRTKISGKLASFMSELRETIGWISARGGMTAFPGSRAENPAAQSVDTWLGASSRIAHASYWQGFEPV